MTPKTVIPRFLLPLQSPLWRGVHIQPAQNLLVRFSSSGNKSAANSKDANGKPVVLEKPLKFNPPSHGSRLKKNTLPKHYGPTLTADEVAAQRQRSYPGMMAPEGTWAHFFWHSRMLHVFITMGTLGLLAISTFFMNYAFNSPFKDLVPPISDLWSHPLEFMSAWKTVIALHEQDKATKAREHRIAHQNDVAKRIYYMKMHGIETKDPITLVFGKSDEKSVEEAEAEAMGHEPPPKTAEDKSKERKKMFGIF